LTYYTLNISKYIAFPLLQQVINRPDVYPGLVIRAPLTPQDQQQGYTAGKITAIKDVYFNFGDLRVAGSMPM